ncbi:ECF transporter S component [Loigolactobacillus bifermentans]|nr:ECF transporter S component [Loigolactobacillus bifermentans]QGG60331.1 ABC transporter permease [Loigolactobacillus bifermentans]
MKVKQVAKTRYQLRDIVLIGIVGVFCGAIFFTTDLAYNVLTAGLSAVGLGPIANELLIGLWMIAGPLAGVLIRRPGACALAEILGGFVEMLLGGEFGAAAVLAGVIQGIGSELGFAITGYRHFDKLGLFLATLTGTIVTFGWRLISAGYSKYSWGFILLLLVVRFISIGFFSGILVQGVSRLVARSGILQHDVSKVG